MNDKEFLKAMLDYSTFIYEALNSDNELRAMYYVGYMQHHIDVKMKELEKETGHT